MYYRRVWNHNADVSGIVKLASFNKYFWSKYPTQRQCLSELQIPVSPSVYFFMEKSKVPCKIHLHSCRPWTFWCYKKSDVLITWIALGSFILISLSLSWFPYLRLSGSWWATPIWCFFHSAHVLQELPSAGDQQSYKLTLPCSSLPGLWALTPRTWFPRCADLNLWKS